MLKHAVCRFGYFHKKALFYRLCTLNYHCHKPVIIMPPKRKASAGQKPQATQAKRAKTDDDSSSGEETSDFELDAEWSEYGDRSGPKNLPPIYMLTGPGIKGSKKIASFDLDMTLIVPSSGKTFPTGPSDWKLMNDKVKPKLVAEHRAGYKIVFITNQRGMEKNHTKPAGWKTKVSNIIKKLGIPVQVFVATGENDFRKPGTKMWDLMVSDYNDGITPDLSSSYYVGDAAGRPKEWAPGKKRDFSCGDRMFAANVGIKFMVPEEYFYDEKQSAFDWRSVNPGEVIASSKKKHKDSYHSKDKEVILMIGSPASGKSTFTTKYLTPQGYVHINRDTLRTPAKCLAATEKAIKEGKSVVVDNTNPSSSSRKDYVKLAAKAKYKVRCFVMDTPLELAHHMNYVRQVQTDGKVRRVPNVAYNVYKKNFQAPTKKEGFSEILTIPFQPIFANESDKKLFMQWTGE